MLKHLKQLGAVLSILAILSAPVVASAATYFADTFVRADSSSGFGTPSDGSAAWSVVSAGSGFSSGISTNRGYITGDNNGALAQYHTLSNHNNIVITLDLTIPATWVSGSYIPIYALSGAVRGSGGGYGLFFNPTDNTLHIYDNGVSKGSVAFTAVAGTIYHVEIDIDSNNWIDAYVYTGAKPGTPTISFNNSSTPYTPASTGTNFRVGWENNSATPATAYFTSLDISSPSAASAPSITSDLILFGDW